MKQRCLKGQVKSVNSLASTPLNNDHSFLSYNVLKELSFGWLYDYKNQFSNLTFESRLLQRSQWEGQSLLSLL